ncbi:hypothetical protein HDU96_005298 [Phlyctochytrium bullatum]|nr:hypothetical protein HDU96_005298 [Phlyctochytrium bullatum]
MPSDGLVTDALTAAGDLYAMLMEASPVSIALAAVAVTVALLLILGQRGSTEQPAAKYPKDIVVLHAFSRPVMHPGLPSYSHFCLKLETYLRVARIPYILATNTGFSKKGKKPYITYNGEEIADSRFCIAWLEEKFGPGIDKQVLPAGRSAVEAYHTMIDNGLAKQIVYWRWRPVHLPWIKQNLFPTMPAPLRAILIPIIMQTPLSYLRLVHALPMDDEEHAAIADARLRSLASLLGDDNYFMSTESPTTMDCAAFGVLSNLLLQDLPHCPWPGRLVRKYPNLVDFVKRMMEDVFPERAGNVDWNKIDEEVLEIAREVALENEGTGRDFESEEESGDDDAVDTADTEAEADGEDSTEGIIALDDRDETVAEVEPVTRGRRRQ